jgi:hypothetical protein
MTRHVLPCSLVLELRDDVTLTPEEELLDAYLPAFIQREKNRRVAQPPRERAAERQAWVAAAASDVRGQG